MRIALFSDIHGNLTGLRAVLDAIPCLGGADIRIAAGDHVMGESGTDEVLELLQEHDVRMVKGDSDTEEKLVRLEAEATAKPGSTRSPAWYYREMRQWLEANLSPAGRALLNDLPHSLTIEAAPDQRLFVCHASPRSLGDRICSSSCDAATVREAFAGVEAEVIAFGHAHESFIRLLDGRPLVNVASVGFRPDGHSRLTFLTYTEGHWLIAQHAIPFDVATEQERTRQRAVPYCP
jgi:predicted phosphodiesterase